MTTNTFSKICAELHEERQKIVDAKRTEYTEGHADILHNFKVVAKELGITPIQVWYVYFRKHIASISQYAAKGITSEPIESRIADAITYLELGLGLIEENDDRV